MTGLFIERPGPRSTIQDRGRVGMQHQGLSPGGAADIRSFRWANHLLGNQPSSACLEVILGGLIARADCNLLLSLSGADCHATVNGQPVDNWGTFTMRPGDTLKLLTPRSGVVSYLAVAGGWQTREFCGSRSTVVREKLRGLGALESRCTLPVIPFASGHYSPGLLRRRVPQHLRDTPWDNSPLGIMPGPEIGHFSALDQARFIQGRYTIGPLSDRMGYRLEGPVLQSQGGITSRAVCCGTVQIPGDGKPMVLLNDRQTIGGYPVIGVIPELETARLAQKRPGEEVAFYWADIADCQSDRLLFEHLYEQNVWTIDGILVGKA